MHARAAFTPRLVSIEIRMFGEKCGLEAGLLLVVRNVVHDHRNVEGSNLHILFLSRPRVVVVLSSWTPAPRVICLWPARKKHSK